jgi:hypothetical protein
MTGKYFIPIKMGRFEKDLMVIPVYNRDLSSIFWKLLSKTMLTGFVWVPLAGYELFQG